MVRQHPHAPSRRSPVPLPAICCWRGRALQHAILRAGDRTVSTYQCPRVSSLASWHCALSVRAAPDGGVQPFRVERDYVQVTGRAMSPRNTGTVRQASSLSGTARRRCRVIQRAVPPAARSRGRERTPRAMQTPPDSFCRIMPCFAREAACALGGNQCVSVFLTMAGLEPAIQLSIKRHEVGWAGQARPW